ncbi:MAG: DUF4032 domain-containing protein [Acidimicrobiia bacterium]|nr:DUF4032 domain-containing protein [Acidimicrobiia bacterium]
MATPHISTRAGHPDFLDLEWDRSITEWDPDRLADLPAGIHRHEIVFVPYRHDIYAIKELPLSVARHEYEMLREFRDRDVPSVTPVGFVERPWVDPTEEWSGAVITRYVSYAFPYRELISGGGFGQRRTQMLDAFAGLLVELHLAGCFWGDCSLSNVLYRYDAGSIDAIMIDAETSAVHDELTTGQRLEDIEIMKINVAGGMADIAASQGLEFDDADLELGEDIAARYQGLWSELSQEVIVGENEHYRIAERVARLNGLGFEVGEVELIPDDGGNRLRLRARVGARTFHKTRLRELTRIDAAEHQAKQILADLRYHEAKFAPETASGKAIAAIQWRVSVFEPMLERIKAALPPGANPVQGYTDFLHHRYVLASEAGHDMDNEVAFESWVAAGKPGYPLPEV